MATSLNTQVRKLHARVLRKRSNATHDFLLNDSEFRFAADCERMRVDRNGSVLSLLLVELPKDHQGQESIDFFARMLEGRIRTTDTPGLLADGRIAVLLPDTTEEGAWKVAIDLSEVYPPGPGRPKCDVLVYPSKNRRDDFEVSSQENGQSALNQDSQPTGEFFFAEEMPLWKRGMDLLGGLTGLLVSLPILLLAAIAIRLTSEGPVFFAQEREGYCGHRFRMWKLRTMRVNAEAMQQDLLEHSHQDGPAFKMAADPRRTTVGKFLRWSSLDELPQFWNVLIGDMSLVGPRPLPTDESAACKNWQRRRLYVVPGMTCTWQVRARGSVRFDEWVRMDIRYVNQYSLFEDLKLLATTFPSLIMQKGIR